MKIQRLFTLIAVAVISIVMVGCASSQKMVAHDQAIADQIKGQLEAPAGPQGPFVIDILVDKTNVTLDGKVKDNKSKDQAAEIAQKTQGVKAVKSFINVK